MQYVECDGCGKRLQGPGGYKTISVRIGTVDAQTHCCTDHCADQAAKVAVDRALQIMRQPGPVA